MVSRRAGLSATAGHSCLLLLSIALHGWNLHSGFALRTLFMLLFGFLPDGVCLTVLLRYKVHLLTYLSEADFR